MARQVSKLLRDLGMEREFYREVVNELLANGADESTIRRCMARDPYTAKHIARWLLSQDEGVEELHKYVIYYENRKRLMADFVIHEGSFPVEDWREWGLNPREFYFGNYRPGQKYVHENTAGHSIELKRLGYEIADPVSLLWWADSHREQIREHSLSVWFDTRRNLIEQSLVTVSFIEEGRNCGKLLVSSKAIYGDYRFLGGDEFLVRKTV